MANGVEEEVNILPVDEQVSRGMELMQMLTKSPEWSASVAGNKFDSPKIADIGWNVIVKQTFIEVVIPACERSMKRSLSDSALPRFQTPEQPWKSLVSDKLDMSDASTNVSLEAEDSNLRICSPRDFGWSSEEEPEADALIHPTSPYQYIDPCWMAMPFSPAGMVYDQAAWAMMPMTWADHSIEAMEYEEGAEWKTTVMIRNMPNNYTREMLLELVDSLGFAGTYDFAYLPVDFQSQAGLGYAFLNFSTVADALLCFERFEGFSDWKVPSEKVCTVTWSSPTQGLEQHIERYKNSPVMHHTLPDEWKPVLYQHGVRVAFPPPSKAIKTPKVRQHPSAKNA